MNSVLKRERRIRLGTLEVAVALEAQQADRVRKSAAYRHVVRPAIERLKAGRSGGNGSSSNGVSSDRIFADAPWTAPATPEARTIIERIADYDWYHSIELGHGVVTPGRVDHRAQLHYYELPEDMTGLRVLDVATYDGFWAFEFERRGADVVAIDVASMRDMDIPRNWVDDFDARGLDRAKGRGFEIASGILGSRVRKEICSVYDLSPDRLGKFDIVFCSDLLIHLRDPLRAMESIWTVTSDRAIFADVFHPDFDAFQGRAVLEFMQKGSTDWWWRPNRACYETWMQVARFSRFEERSRFNLQSNFGDVIPKVVYHAYR